MCNAELYMYGMVSARDVWCIVEYFVHHFYLYRNFIYLFLLYICLRCGEFYCICGDWLKIVYDLEQGS